jgi:hypothetical protein
MRARKSSPYLIKKDTSGMNKKNKNILTKLHNEYTIPFYQKNTETIGRQIQTLNHTKIIRDLKPFLSKKKSHAYFVNNIALMSLTGIERGMIIEMENTSLPSPGRTFFMIPSDFALSSPMADPVTSEPLGYCIPG